MPLKTSHLTVLLTDIKGFTDKTSRKSRADIIAMLEKHKELVLPVLTSRGGRLIKTIGDAFLMTFESPTDAVLAGVAVQDALRNYNAGRSADDRLDVRIAINSGEVALADNDIFGDPVNITARIEGVAQAGEVFFTEAVYLAMNKNEVPSSEVGLLQLKGIPEKIRVYKVKREHPVGAASSEISSEAQDQEPVLPVPGLAAVPLGVAARPSLPALKRPALSRRAGALLIDFAICATIVGFFWPSNHAVHVGYHSETGGKQADQTGAGQIHIDGNGINIQDKDDKVNLGKNGINVRAHVQDGNDVVNIGPGGINITDRDGKEVQTAQFGHWGISTSHINWHFALVWYILMIIFLKRWNSTPGGCIFKLAVVRKDGSPMAKSDRTMRAASSLVSAYFFMLGFLWALWEKDGRGWHDLLAGTMVVDDDSCLPQRN